MKNKTFMYACISRVAQTQVLRKSKRVEALGKTASVIGPKCRGLLMPLRHISRRLEAAEGTIMNILSGVFHHGLIVDDIQSAMAKMGQEGGFEWTDVRLFDPLPVWSPEQGRGEAQLKVAYSRRGPIHMELIEATPGSPYDVLCGADPSHIGVWVDNVGDCVDELIAQGWRVLVAGTSDSRRYGSIAYVARDAGPVIELVSRELEPMMNAWWA
jgi:hypothetical protein